MHFHRSAWAGAALFAFLTTTAATAAEDERPGVRDEGHQARGLSDLELADGSNPLRPGPVPLKAGDDEAADSSRNWLFTSREVIGTPVVNPAGKELGAIDEMIVDVSNGGVRYAALEFPTLFGRDKLLAIPWGSLKLTVSPQNRLYFTLDMPIEKLKKAPGFPRDEWPDIGNRKWAERIDILHGVIVKEGDLTSDFGTDVEPLKGIPHLMRTGQLIGTRVNNLSGKKLGKVSEAIFDFQTGKVRFAVIRLDDNTAKGRMFPVPIAALKIDRGEKPQSLVLGVDHILLGKAPFFEEETWPNIREPHWAEEVDRFFGVKSNVLPEKPTGKPEETNGK